MRPEVLDAAIASGDPDRVVAVLAGSTEAERAAAAEVPRRWNERLRGAWHQGGDPVINKKNVEGILTGTILATLGTIKRPEIHHAFNIDYARAARVLADRKPGWVEKWATDALRRFPGCWPLARHLELLGAIPR